MPNVAFSNLSILSAPDVNGDSKIDLLVTGADPTSSSYAVTTTQLRNGNNSRYCLPSYSFPSTADAVPPFCVLADLNGDGLPDKIFAGEYPNTSNPLEVDYPYIKVQFATGAGTYAPAVKYSVGGRGLFIASVATGDFNGDGRTDVALLRMAQRPDGDATGIEGYVFLLLGDGKGGFTLTHSFATGVFDFTGRPVNLSDFFPNMPLASLDLNGDGKSDLIVYGSAGGIPDFVSGISAGQGSGLVSYLSNGDGTFTLAQSASVSASASDISSGQIVSVTIGDFNGDGLNDIAMQNTAGTMPVFLGKGGGKFTASASAQGSSAFAIGDFHLDGAPDIAVPTINGFTRVLNAGFSTWPKVSSLPLLRHPVWRPGQRRSQRRIGRMLRDWLLDLLWSRRLRERIRSLSGGVGAVEFVADCKFALGQVS